MKLLLLILLATQAPAATPIQKYQAGRERLYFSTHTAAEQEIIRDSIEGGSWDEEYQLALVWGSLPYNAFAQDKNPGPNGRVAEIERMARYIKSPNLPKNGVAWYRWSPEGYHVQFFDDIDSFFIDAVDDTGDNFHLYLFSSRCSGDRCGFTLRKRDAIVGRYSSKGKVPPRWDCLETQE